MKLSDSERIILINQYEILARLARDEDEKKKFEFAKDCLYYGYVDLYDEFLPRLDEQREFREVFDILNMYRDLLNSYFQLEETDISIDDIKFKGFDGNDETDYYLFAKFLLENTEMYMEIKENNIDGFNTHYRRLGKYRRQLEIWRPLSKRNYLEQPYLTEEQIKQIIEA